MVCSGALQEHWVCLPAAACREAAWRRCLSLSPSRSLHVLASLLSACFTFLPSVFDSLPHAFQSLWLLSITTEMFPRAHVQPAVGLSSPCCSVFLEPVCYHLPHICHLLYIYIKKTIWLYLSTHLSSCHYNISSL